MQLGSPACVISPEDIPSFHDALLVLLCLYLNCPLLFLCQKHHLIPLCSNSHKIQINLLNTVGSGRWFSGTVQDLQV